MRYSQLFGKTVKDAPSDAKSASHKYLYQGGFIRESSGGRYYFLPLGQLVQQKIIRAIKDEMDRANAQEILTPVLHSLELWKETNRNKETGFELMTIKDRRDFEFALGGTAEEMLVDLVRKFQISYKDLPFNLYQFSLKFRDELRARGGLLRVREFIMKDAYSFHEDEKDFKKEYQSMWNTYTRIFDRLGLKTVVVEADGGYIGGDYCHEFQVLTDVGEDSIFHLPSKKRYFNREITPSKAPAFDQKGEKPKEIKEVKGVGIIGVEELAKFLKIPVEATTKTLLFETEKGKVVAVAVRGDYDVSETKLKKILDCRILTLISSQKIKKLTGAEMGYAGILNLPKSVLVLMDDSMEGRINFEVGANRTNYHTINVNFGRDLKEPQRFYDFKLAKKGDLNPETGEVYEISRGIEVGNIFQLGYHYSRKMKNAVFTDKDGKLKPYYMGCYGIGIGRTMAAIVEIYHDKKGIAWPEASAPYQVHLIGIGLEDKSVSQKAEQIYKALLEKNVEVLYDDRQDASAGVKFADSDLIGIPVRLVVSKKTGDKIEVKKRNEDKAQLFSFDEVLKKVRV